MKIEVRDSLKSIAPAAWDRVVGDGCPFFEHAFLYGLEVAGCVGPETGWAPRYVLAFRDSDLVGALPMYRKTDSYGEFIFDWGWADAAHRAGLPYYPKMVVAAPFSPVGGRRFLLAPGEGDKTRSALLAGARQATIDEPATGLHLLFVSEDESDFLEKEGFAIRHTHQFQWHNEGYQTFEDFLGRFRSKRRNQIRRERRGITEAGVTIRIVEGDRIGLTELDHAWRFYTHTVDRYFYGRRYLNRAFFEYLFTHFRHRLLLVFAERDGEVIGGALNIRKGAVMYGRYWGSDDDIRYLHFEVCSYSGIEASIERGIQRFEAGAGGGGHKFGRGFLPTLTRSAHEIYVTALDRAVRGALAQEREELALQMAHAEGRVLK